ncbi:MAG TPA: toll/interleukin-1 receptor domain-containing protein, partial [Aggregatilineales bacterium]|nr:toll/interleukin-1 receptor domain-containing protein [Aggregatilineales bacterium]
MIIELLSDQITSSIVEAIWNRPEIAMLREPIERRLSAKTFRDKTRRALQDFEQSSASLLPDLFSSKFVGQKEVQRCLSDYIVAGRPADITRFLELYAKNRGGGEPVTLSSAAKDSVRRYFEHLRESLASDPEYGPLLAARDQKTMLSALDTISEGFLSVKEQVDRLTDVLQTLSKTPEFRQIERRTAALPDVFAQHVVPVLAELGVRDLRNIAEAALGSDSPLLANFVWPETPDEAAQRLCEALGTAEGYPGRAAIAALLQAAMHYSPAHASRLADPLELVSGMLERRTRATYIEEGLLCIAHADERVAQALANELRAAGLNVWLDSEAVMAGHSLRQQRFDAVERCETLVLCLTAGALDDGAVRRMAASAALLGKQILILPFDPQADLRAYPDTAPLAELAPVRLDDPARAGEAVIAALTAVRVTRNPYKGLEAFDETDAPYYFGHEALIERLVQLVALAGVGGFAAVIGSSGSGKSSLVRAG